MTLIYIIVSIIVILLIGMLVILYLEGHWTIESREVVKSNTYNVSIRSGYDGRMIPDGKETKEVHKITYRNKRIRYITKTLYH